jgi:hypothetical protein
VVLYSARVAAYLAEAQVVALDVVGRERGDEGRRVDRDQALADCVVEADDERFGF